MVVPSHEAQIDAAALTGGYDDVKLVTIAARECYKHRLLAGETLAPLIEQLVSGEHIGAQVIDDEATRAINRRLEAHLYDDFQVHLKRVFALRTPSGKIHRVLAKSAGWGWLGYHAYLAGTRLQEYVPKVYGLRNGMLFSEWLEAHSLPAEGDAARAERIAGVHGGEGEAAVAGRRFSGGADGSGGEWGLHAGQGAARGVSAVSALAEDGRTLEWIEGVRHSSTDVHRWQLGAGEWLSDGTKPRKIDYEHHGFGNPAPNIVDAAYDVALAMLQSKLSPEAQRLLLEEFVRLSGDEGAGERVVLHALGCGHLAARVGALPSFARAHG